MPIDEETIKDKLTMIGIMPSAFAEKISESVGLRNGIVHQYEKIETDRMLNDIRNNIGDYVEYVKYITAFIIKKS